VIKSILTYLLLFPALLFQISEAYDDYYFDLVDSVIFPTNAKCLDFQVVDWDDNGIDELLISYEYSNYLYSFESDSFFYSDSTIDYQFSRNTGIYALDYNDSPDLELVIIGSHNLRNQINVKNDLTDSVTLVHTVDELIMNYSRPSADMFYGDADNDGDDEVILTFLGDYLIYYDYVWNLEYVFEGNMISLNKDDYSTNWYMDGGLYSSHKEQGLEKAKYIDVDNDGDIEIVGYGWYYYYNQYMDYGPPDIVRTDITSLQVFNLFDHNGDTLMKSHRSDVLSVTAGKINNISPGDDIVVFKDGYFYDTTFFMPTDLYGLYCLSYVDDSLQLVWANDAEAHQANLFSLPSIPNSFCTANSTGTIDLYDGNTGDKMGEIYGLNHQLATEEGYFIDTADSTMQVIQRYGMNKIYLYQLSMINDIEDDAVEAIPSGFSLVQNYPNPFNPTTEIHYTVPKRTNVSIEIYNLLGRKITSLVNEEKSAGDYSVTWDGTDSKGSSVGSGIYFYQIKAGDFRDARKMLLLK